MFKKIFCCFIFFILFSKLNVFAISKEDLIPNADSGILIETNSGRIIFEKNKDKRVSIASMTKMMAQILILESIENGKINWDDIVTVSKNAASMGGSQIYIAEGEKISIRDLMKGISMASGNDATVQMAEVVGGTEENFVKLMNKKAKSLGLKNTHFNNSTGLDEENHFSTAYDMSIIARELILKHPEIFEFSSVYEDYLRENTKNKFWLVNTNKLVRFYDGADGLKTGHTDAAGYCLAATAKRNGLRLLGIVLGESNAKVRNKETMELLDYGYQTLRIKKLKKKGEIIKKINISKADSEIVNIVLKDDVNIIYDSSDIGNDNYKYKIKLFDFKLPVKVGDEIGRLDVISNNNIIMRVPLTVSNNVLPLSFWQLFKKELISITSG